jgi:sugar diacid utilization regulator
MKISMWMLFDALEGQWARYNLDEHSKRICIKGILPYMEAESRSDEYVYIVDAGRSNPVHIPSELSYLIISGEHYVFEQSCTSQCIFLKSDYTFTSALYTVCKAFEKYSDWHTALQAELNDGPNLNRLCALGSRILENDAILYDKDYTIIAGAVNNGSPDWYVERNGPYYALSAKAVRQLKNDINFQQTFRQTGAAVCKVDFLPYSVLYVNLNKGSIYEGRLCITDSVRPFKNGDYQIAEILTEFLRLAVRRQAFQANDESRVFEAFLLKMLDGYSPTEEQLIRALRFWHWKRFGKYICIRISQNELDTETSSDRYLISRIAMTLKGSVSVRGKEGIACIVSLSEKETSDELTKKLAALLETVVPNIGVSDVFEDFSELAQFHKQAAIAAEMGAQENPKDWRHFFQDYAMAHYYKFGTSVLPAIHFCDRDVRRLMSYRNTRTDYYHTLKVYLENNMNLLETSNALFIHRTTLFNRISKIKELISADLGNPEDRIRMLISFRLMEADKTYRKA